MKKKKYALIIISIVILLSIVLTYIIINSKKDSYLSILYTDKNLVSTYGMYDLESSNFKALYTRTKNGYADISIDKKNNILFYSDKDGNESVSSIVKVDLSKNNDNTTKLVNGDIFDVYNNTIFFRKLQDGHHKFSIGSYNIDNGKWSIWNNTENDLTSTNFYYNFLNKKLYTIEFSLAEVPIKRLPNMPTNKIVQYDTSGVKEKEIYSTNKNINNISINKKGNKVLFDAASFENDRVTNKIYLVNLDTGNEEILIKPNDVFNNETFISFKSPQFSLDEKGFYFIGTTTESKVIEQVKGTTPTLSNAIYYYEFDTKKVSKIFEAPNMFINKFKIQVTK